MRGVGEAGGMLPLEDAVAAAPAEDEAELPGEPARADAPHQAHRAQPSEADLQAFLDDTPAPVSGSWMASLPHPPCEAPQVETWAASNEWGL